MRAQLSASRNYPGEQKDRDERYSEGSRLAFDYDQEERKAVQQRADDKRPFCRPACSDRVAPFGDNQKDHQSHEARM
jgi:hypothetical protein